MSEEKKEVKFEGGESEFEKFAKEAGLSEFKSIEDFASSYKKLAEEKKKLEESSKRDEKAFSDLLTAARKDVTKSQASANSEAVQSYLSDPVVKRNVEVAISKEGNMEEFQKDVNEGRVSLREIKVWSKLGEEPSEGSEGLGSPNPNAGESIDKKQDELMHIVRKESHIWNNESHPRYKEVKTRMLQLEKELELNKSA